MVDTTSSGTDIIRAGVKARNAKHNLAPIARDLGLAAGDLEQWAANPKAVLAPQHMSALAKYLFAGFADYDAATDRLVKVEQPQLQPFKPEWPPRRVVTNNAA